MFAGRAAALALIAGLAAAAAPAPAQTSPPAAGSSVVVDSNPAVFAVLAALSAAGYDPPGANPSAASAPSAALRARLRQQLISPNPTSAATVKQLQAFYQSHHRADANQDLAQYVTLALFLSSPPGLSLTVPPAGLPPDAAAVADVVPLVQQFYADAAVEAIWNRAQPQMQIGLDQDKIAARRMLTTVDTYFRIPQAYSTRQLFIFPDPLLSPAQSDALNYNDNYYITVNLDLEAQLAQVRHTYLHFILDPLIARYPAAIEGVGEQVLPQVARAPALDLQFKRDPQLLFTECLVRAVEIVLDPGTEAQKQAAVAAAQAQGLVITPYWYSQLATYATEPENFAEFYPVAAFAARWDEIASLAKHTNFAPEPATAGAAAMPQPVRAPGLLELGQERLDARDFAAAEALADSALQKPGADHASAYFLLGKAAAEQNQAKNAATDFGQALAQPGASAHVRTWSNIFLARLYDAENNRAQAVTYYKAALATADTPVTKSLAANGIKAPYRPPPPPGR